MNRPGWQTEGENPDYRFSLANERTFLAWIRTSLALIGSGMVLDQLGTSYPRAIVLTASLALAFIGALFCCAAYHRWRANEIAMRHKQALPHTMFTALVCTVVALASMLACTLILVNETK